MAYVVQIYNVTPTWQRDDQKDSYHYIEMTMNNLIRTQYKKAAQDSYEIADQAAAAKLILSLKSAYQLKD